MRSRLINFSRPQSCAQFQYPGHFRLRPSTTHSPYRIPRRSAGGCVFFLFFFMPLMYHRKAFDTTAMRSPAADRGLIGAKINRRHPRPQLRRRDPQRFGEPDDGISLRGRRDVNHGNRGLADALVWGMTTHLTYDLTNTFLIIQV